MVLAARCRSLRYVPSDTVDNRTLEHGCGMIDAGVPSFFALRGLTTVTFQLSEFHCNEYLNPIYMI